MCLFVANLFVHSAATRSARRQSLFPPEFDARSMDQRIPRNLQSHSGARHFRALVLPVVLRFLGIVRGNSITVVIESNRQLIWKCGQDVAWIHHPVYCFHPQTPALVCRPGENQQDRQNPDDSPLRLIWLPHRPSDSRRMLADPIEISFPAVSPF